MKREIEEARRGAQGRATPSNGANELPEWPSVLKIANDEFQQSVAVAQLAVKLWENKIARVQGPLTAWAKQSVVVYRSAFAPFVGVRDFSFTDVWPRKREG